jgi:hypothetical protein
VPCVVEGFDLGVGVVAGFVSEDGVVRGVGVERRIEVDQVDRLGLDPWGVVAQDVEVVPVVENVRLHRGSLRG